MGANLPQRLNARLIRFAIHSERRMEPVAFIMLVPGIDNDGVGRIEIAIGLVPGPQRSCDGARREEGEKEETGSHTLE